MYGYIHKKSALPTEVRSQLSLGIREKKDSGRGSSRKNVDVGNLIIRIHDTLEGVLKKLTFLWLCSFGANFGLMIFTYI